MLAQASDLKIKKPTPGKAIGFWFIPFYGFYWTFIVWMNLAKHMNHMTGRSSGKIPVRLVVIGCGLFLTGALSPGNLIVSMFVNILTVAGIVILLLCNFYFYKAAADICVPPGASASRKKPAASNA